MEQGWIVLQAQAFSEPDYCGAHDWGSNVLKACQSLQGPGPGMRVVHARSGIIAIQFDAAIGQSFDWCFPRAKNPFFRQVLKARDPMFDVCAFGIEFFTLGDGVENPEIGSCVCSTTCCPLPALRVAG